MPIVPNQILNLVTELTFKYIGNSSNAALIS